jgi:hypothetical protein
MSMSTNFDSILVGAYQCADCRYAVNYNPIASSTYKKVSSDYKKEIINQGKIDVALFSDTVCLEANNCLGSFNFQVQKAGLGLSKELGGLIGIGPGGPANMLDQLYNDGAIGAKMYAFYNPSSGGKYDLAVRVGQYDPKLVKPETT